MPRYLWNVLIGFDIFANAILGGNPRETISSRIGRYMRNEHQRHWVERLPWPRWLKKHFIETDDRTR
jgi:hypothetical protein